MLLIIKRNKQLAYHNCNFIVLLFLKALHEKNNTQGNMGSFKKLF